MNKADLHSAAFWASLLSKIVAFGAVVAPNLPSNVGHVVAAVCVAASTVLGVFGYKVSAPAVKDSVK